MPERADSAAEPCAAAVSAFSRVAGESTKPGEI